MAFNELAMKRFSVRKYTDEPVSKDNLGPKGDCPWRADAAA